jgi:protein-tyrosine phosphatase
MTEKTSLTHPLYLDWLPGIAPGKVGLTIAPGKHSTAKYTHGLWRRDLARDLDDLAKTHGVTDLVCLLEDADMARLHIGTLLEEARRRGLRVHHLPLPDGGTPTDLEAVRPLVEAIDARVREGALVAIHCEGGLGRTGLVAGCYLAHLGASGEQALATLAAARGPHCPENAAQRAFVTRYAGAQSPWAGAALRGPFVAHGLEVYLLEQDDDPALPPLVTLAEAMTREAVVVHETGDVNALALDNLGEVAVVCLAGDLVKGGRQDRAIAADVVLAPGARGVRVTCFCVESARWQPRGEERADRFVASDHVAPAELRRQIWRGTGQAEVWAGVAQTQEDLGRGRGAPVRDARSATSLQLTLESPELAHDVRGVVEPLLRITASPQARGYVAVVGGQIRQLEWFGTGALHRALWPRVTRALALEAVTSTSAGRAGRAVPDKTAVARWLSQVWGAGAAPEGRSPGARPRLVACRWPGQTLVHVAVTA